MNKDNTSKLIKDFPMLYRGYTKPPTYGLMCFGFECGDGWFDLIYELSQEITKLDPNCEAMQVKEKFGGLRFYINPSAEEVIDLISEYEKRSYSICMQCGSTENVSQTKSGWVATLCSKCMEKLVENKPILQPEREKLLKNLKENNYEPFS